MSNEYADLDYLRERARAASPNPIRFRLRYVELGGHTHIRVFAGQGEILGLAGTLVLRNEEWGELRQKLALTTNIEIVEEYNGDES